MDVAAWLAGLGLERYAAAFVDNHVDAEALAGLTVDDLIALGVASVGHRRKLLSAITALQLGGVATKVHAERRQLTVLFCDMVGSTALSVRLDPEDMREVIRAYQATCTRLVAQYQGTVANFIGDGLLVYFGWPRAHEDDAERAVQAGLALVHAVGALTVPGGGALSVRVGISTGPVVVGDLIREGPAQAHSAVGETPNLAAGLQTLAAPRQVVLGESTRRLLAARFDLKPLGVRELPGIGQPVAAYLVEGEHATESRFEARSGPAPSPMVGREYEMAVLMERWTQAQSGEGQAILLVGESGFGKSRITRALIDAVAAQPHIAIRWQCSPYHTDSALWPVIQQITRAARITPDDPPATARAKLDALLAAGGGVPPDEAALLAALVGLDASVPPALLPSDPRMRRMRTLQALDVQLRRLASHQPVLMIVEDAHWIDPTSLELIERSLEGIGRCRILMLLTSRTDRQPALAAHPQVTALTLNRLTRLNAQAIIARLGGDGLPAEVVATIVEQTDGVPLFVEELTKAVLETGETSVPATLHDSLMARLDRTPQVKDVAQVAACIGREFDHALLAAVAERPAEALRSAIEQLIRAELIFRRGVAPHAHYTFKHALVRDAAYDSLLRRRRQEIHARIFEVLEAGRVPAEAEVLGHHAERAGLVAKAIGSWQRAGEQALLESAYHEAADYLGRAVDLVETQPDTPQRRYQELELQVRLGNALTATQGYSAAATRRAFVRAHTLYRSVGKFDDPVLRLSMFYGLWTVVYVRGESAKSLRQAQEFLAEAQNEPDDTHLVLAHRLAGASSLMTGDFAHARDHLERTLALHDPERHHALTSQLGTDIAFAACCNLASVLYLLGFAEQGAAVFEPARADVAGVANVNARADSHYLVCVTAIRVRDAEMVRQHAGILGALAHEHRLPLWQANASLFRAWSDHEQGRLAEAVAGYEGSMPRLEVLGQRLMMSYFLSHHAAALAASGRADEARWRSQQAIVESDRTAERWCAAELWRLRGQVFLHSRPHGGTEAERCFERAMAVAHAQGALLFELRAATSLCQLLAERGERSKARELLAGVHDRFTEGFDTADLVEAQALLDALG